LLLLLVDAPKVDLAREHLGSTTTVTSTTSEQHEEQAHEEDHAHEEEHAHEEHEHEDAAVPQDE